MVGLSMPEILVLLIMIGVPAGAIYLVLFLVRRLGGSRVAVLEAENRQLREQLDQKRGRGEPLSWPAPSWAHPPETGSQVERQNVRDIVITLYGKGDPAARLETLSRLVVDLLVEVEALRGAVTQLSVGAAGGSVHRGDDGPCHDRTLVEGKSAYPAAYVDAAYVLHNAAGPTGGIDKLLARFYLPSGNEPREALMLRRLGFSNAEIARFIDAAKEAEQFT